MMKAGFVGAGPWARKVAAKLRGLGVEISEYDRRSDEPPPEELGSPTRRPWPEMISSRSVDMVIAMATPDVTLEVAKAAARAGIPVLATKPFMIDFPISVRAPFMVDYVRLYSPLWKQIRKAANYLSKVEIEFCGRGPIRTFPGLHDYAPHALAFVCDLLEDHAMTMTVARAVALHREDGSQLFRVSMKRRSTLRGPEISLLVGNGSTLPKRLVSLTTVDSNVLVYDEDPWNDPLGIMLGTFIEQVRRGEIDLEPMLMSCQITNFIRQIEEASGMTTSSVRSGQPAL